MTTKEFISNFEHSYPQNSRNLIIEFFIAFARFECALKASIHFAHGNQDKVQANWDAFTSSLKDQFNHTEKKEINNAVQYILSYPPKIQILENGRLSWRDRKFEENSPLITKLGLHIRDIRNNLFHGGKFNGVYEGEVSRNCNLLESSLVILNEWLSLNESVRENFLEKL